MRLPRPEPLLELSSRFTHVVKVDDLSVLVGHVDSVVLEGRAVGQLLTLLDGTRTAVDIAGALSTAFKPQVVYLALLQLQEDGVVRECPLSGDPPQLDERATGFQRAWETRGDARLVRIGVARGREVRRLFLLTEDYLHAELGRALQAPSSAQQRPAEPCALVRLGREDAWIGPGLGGPAGPCIACLQTRLRMNLPGRAFVADHMAATAATPQIKRLPYKTDPAVFQLISDGLREIGDEGTDTPGIWSFGLGGAHAVFHSMPKLPQCSQCGDPKLQHPGSQFTLSDRESKEGSASGLRTRAPQETWDAYASLIDPLTGVVRRIEKVEVGEYAPIHVYTASHADGLGPPTVAAIQDEGRDQSGGKGYTDLDARVSALGESLERFSALHRGTEVEQRARLSDLGPDTFHPNELMLFSETQFESRDRWNARLSGSFQWVPEAYQDEEIAWSSVRSLVTGQVCLVPSAFVYLSYRGEGRRFCRADSNGLAGGNCLEEAILQGFFELVERDAVALWWYNRGRVPAVDSAGLDPEYVRVLEAYYDSLGRDMWTLDLTTDLGIPCIGAFSSRRDGPSKPKDGREIIFGFGSHLDPRVALRRALTELNQMIPTVQRTPQEREKHLLPEFGDALTWFESATLSEHPHLVPKTSIRPVDFPDADRVWEIRGAIDECLIRAQAAGLDVFVHELTREDVGFSVARVIVPGLRHFWRRTAPGRLYDVPPKLGWTEGVQAENDLNPVSMFV